jgi:hypothetical protein
MTALSFPQDAQGLAYGPLVVGMPVITDHMDQPCTLMVAVFTGFSGVGAAKVRFLADWEPHTHDVFANDAEGVTPLSAFGVAIEVMEQTCERIPGKFRCVPILGAESTAHFRNGSPRHWQHYNMDDMWWPYRPEVLKMLDRSFVL